MIELILWLENEDDKFVHYCGSTMDLEDILKNEDLTKYCYKKIYFSIDDEINHKISKLYEERYLS